MHTFPDTIILLIYFDMAHHILNWLKHPRAVSVTCVYSSNIQNKIYITYQQYSDQEAYI